MRMVQSLTVLLLIAAAPAWARSDSPPLKLQLPADSTSAQSSSPPQAKADSDPAASSTPATANAPLPSAAPYDATYGTRRDAAQKACDDKTYGQPQVHGSVGVGVASGKRVSGNYETATLDVTKALGSCDDPKGIVSASITVSKSNDNLRHRRHP